MSIEEFKNKFGIVSRSKEIYDICEVILQIAQSDISVLIYGESGVGKEVFARAIHGVSKRATQPLVSVNCGAIPEGILESELFGHKKGSFTGAIEGRKGYFELADTGTLFLDEIGEMPLTTQVKLLRAIETKEFMRIGAENLTKVDVRYIAATNKNLQFAVDSKKFREDLYFRIKAVTLTIPPLRKRKNDIEPLVNRFLNNFELENKLKKVEIKQSAWDALYNYPWPGNVRELKNTVETALVLNKGEHLTADSFSNLLTSTLSLPENTSKNVPVVVRKSSEEVDRELIFRALIELKKDILELKDIVQQKGEVRNMPFVIDSHETSNIKEAEKTSIINALKKAKYNKRIASEMLGISERTLYRKIKEYDIVE